MSRHVGLTVLLLLCAARARAADDAPLPPGDAKPVLQLEAGGPTAAVTAMLFSADGIFVSSDSFSEMSEQAP